MAFPAPAQAVLARHEYSLSKYDRQLRVARVELVGGRRIVGVRFPAYLAGEVITMLRVGGGGGEAEG